MYLKISQNLQKKTLVLESPFKSKKRLRHRQFPVSFAKFLKASFFTEHLQVSALQEYTGSIGKYLYKVNIIYYIAEAVVMEIFLVK